MGETMADTLRDEIQIEKAASFETGFKDSVSFGRFENDLLSWERWSSFSQNKYLEEVEKCSTPGSVAEKKAYFEAHYKKIAARKAELMEQEQKMGDDSLRSDTPSNGNSISNGFGSKLVFDTLGIDGIANLIEPNTNATYIDEPNQDAIGVNGQDSFVARVEEEVDDLPDTLNSNNLEVADSCKEENQLLEPDAQLEEKFDLVKKENDSTKLQAQSEEVDILVQEKNHLMGSRYQLEQSQTHAQVKKMKDAKPKLQKESQKRTPGSKDNNLTRTKKTQVASLQRASKPAPASPVVSASKISTRKESSPSLPKMSIPSAVARKRSTPNSLHMSLSLEPSPAITRRSFIMEKMGDKEIVKRTFRAFQNNFNLSKPSSEAKSSTPQQISAKGTERVTSASTTPQKEKEGVKKSLEKTSSQRRQVGARGNTILSGPVKAAGEHQTNTRAAPSSFVLRSDERAEKAKESFKKVEKSNAKETDRKHLQSKSKEKKEAEMEKASQSLNFKTTSVPGFYRGHGVSKTNANKVAANNKIHHQPDSRR